MNLNRQNGQFVASYFHLGLKEFVSLGEAEIEFNLICIKRCCKDYYYNNFVLNRNCSKSDKKCAAELLCFVPSFIFKKLEEENDFLKNSYNSNLYKETYATPKRARE